MNHPAIARRSLLTAAGCALLRPAAASSGHERLQNNTYAADIIVIGFGAAGASAAIEAARAGSSVLILEKSPQKSHCSSTRMSSGIYLCPDRGISEEVLAQYIASTYLPDGGVSYREGKMDPDLTALARIWAKLGPQTYEWLHSLDPDFRQATSALYAPLGGLPPSPSRAHRDLRQMERFSAQHVRLPQIGNQRRGSALCLFE